MKQNWIQKLIQQLVQPKQHNKKSVDVGSKKKRNKNSKKAIIDHKW